MTMKVDASGNPVKYKARLVAQRFTQRYGIDHGDTFDTVIIDVSLKTQPKTAVQFNVGTI